MGFDLTEKFLDFLLHHIHIEVAHNHDGLKIRPVPLLIIVAQISVRKVINNIHTADRHTIFIFASLVDFWHHILHHALHGHTGTPVSPLFMNNTTFLVYLLRFEIDILTPVVEYQKTRIDNALTLDRGRPDVIDCLIYRCIGIQVGPKLYTYGFTPRHDSQLLPLAREMLGTIKSHVLQKMSQSTLTGFLKDGTYALGNIEIGKACLFIIMSYIVSQSILQLSLSHGSVLLHSLSKQ